MVTALETTLVLVCARAARDTVKKQKKILYVFILPTQYPQPAVILINCRRGQNCWLHLVVYNKDDPAVPKQTFAGALNITRPVRINGVKSPCLSPASKGI
jgi:hypothetical protein